MPAGSPTRPAGEDGPQSSDIPAEFNGVHRGSDVLDGRISGATQELLRTRLNGNSRPPRIFVPETFRTSRLLDFSSRRELTAQIGHEPFLWPLVAVKELVDNGIDAAEQAGVAPRIRITLRERMIEVVDNGPGIAGDVVDGILDFTVRVSSREAYVGPWRGAQGNALKTICTMPFALDGKAGRLEIRSRGIRHLIGIAINPIAQQPEVELVRRASLVKTGTAVRVHWPDLPRSIGGLDLARFAKDLASLAERYALFNPHLRLACRIQGKRAQAGEPTDIGWKRWRPSDPPVAAWYDDDRFQRLFCALLGADRKAGRVRLVRDLLADFRGLSSTGKRKAILAKLGLARASLEDLVDKDGGPDRERLALLLAEMQEGGTAPRAAALGIIGKDHLLERLQLSEKGLESFDYRKIIAEDPPRVTELAFAHDKHTRTRRQVLCGMNSKPGADGCQFLPSDRRARARQPARAPGATGRASARLRHAPCRRPPRVRRPRQVRPRHRWRARRGGPRRRHQDHRR